MHDTITRHSDGSFSHGRQLRFAAIQTVENPVTIEIEHFESIFSALDIVCVSSPIFDCAESDCGLTETEFFSYLAHLAETGGATLLGAVNATSNNGRAYLLAADPTYHNGSGYGGNLTEADLYALACNLASAVETAAESDTIQDFCDDLRKARKAANLAARLL